MPSLRGWHASRCVRSFLPYGVLFCDLREQNEWSKAKQINGAERNLFVCLLTHLDLCFAMMVFRSYEVASFFSRGAKKRALEGHLPDLCPAVATPMQRTNMMYECNTFFAPFIQKKVFLYQIKSNVYEKILVFTISHSLLFNFYLLIYY